MNVQVTTLIENNPGEHLALKHEHGISFYIKAGEVAVLFDTGQSGAFLENAGNLSIDLSEVSHVVLSHGHYDHSGGFPEFARVHEGFTTWTGRGFFEPKYGHIRERYEFLGNRFTQELFSQYQIEHRTVDSPVTEIAPGVYIITDFPRIHPEERINSRFVLRREDGSFVPDLFTDEIMIAIESPRGLVLLLGCSHPGVMNMIDAARKYLGKEVYAILGGTHLVEASQEAFGRALSSFDDGSIEVVGVSHCTGKEAMTQMGLNNRRYFHNRTGSSLFVQQ